MKCATICILFFASLLSTAAVSFVPKHAFSHEALLKSKIDSNALNRRLQTDDICTENCCTFCADELSDSRKDTIINFGGEGLGEGFGQNLTCEQAAAVASILPQDNEGCLALQLLGHLYCGCPTLPNGSDELCTLCYDGSPIPDAERVVELDFGDEEATTCGEVQLGLYFLDTLGGNGTIGGNPSTAGDEPDVDFCSLTQNSVGPLCGCPVNPDAPAGCSICPPGRALSNPDHVVDADQGLTCEQGAQQVSLIVSVDDDTCDMVKQEAANAGCECENFLTSSAFTTAISSLSSLGIILVFAASLM